MIKRTPRSTGTFILFAAMLILMASSLPAWAGAVTIVSVQSGHSVVIDTNGLKRVAVGDSRIAGVVPIGTSQIVINGKTPGHTTVLVWSSMNGHQTYEVTVTEQSVDDVARILRAAINQPDVQVLSFDNNLVLRGTVPDQAAFNQLQDLLGRFTGIKISGQDAKLVNAVTVSHPLGAIEQKAMGFPGSTDVHLDPDGQGNVIVSGRVHDRADAQQVIERARGLAGAYLAASGKVIDRLTTETNSQIDVKVYILEVDRTFMNNLGIRLQGGQLTQTVTQAGGVATTVSYGNPSFIGLEDPNRVTPAFSFGKFFRTTLLAPTLDLLIQEGHGRLLSSPDLVTLPGQEATFLVGGEIPIPFSSGLGQTTIIYKTFGVQLDVTPSILGNGAIDTKIIPEVSDLDFQDGVQLNGFTVPALKTSKLSTEVITQSGEAVVLGGLLRRVETRTIQKIPILGDLPILGKLFRSTDYQNNNTDVVFVMEPTVITR